jgi:hypothetical protein
MPNQAPAFPSRVLICPSTDGAAPPVEPLPQTSVNRSAHRHFE